MNWKTNVIKFLSAQTISLFGSSLVQYAMIWYITLHTESGLMMSIATICGYAPQLLISLYAGVWVDRYERKFMCMLADGIIALVTLIIMFAFMMGYRYIELLFVVLFIRSFMTGIQTPAVLAMLPQLVPKEHLLKVNGIHATIQSIMMFLAPAISGVILMFMNIELTFLIDIITAIIAIIMMFTIAIPNYKRNISHVSMRADMNITFQYLKQQRSIRNLLIFMFFVCFFISPAAFLTPLLVARTFGNEVWRLSFSEMTFSLGAISGGILISSWGGFRDRLQTIVYATILYGTMMLGLGISSVFIAYAFCNFLIGIAMPCYNASAQSYVQEEVEESMHGRIFSIVQIVNACALPLGTAIFGPMADMINEHVIFLATGMIVIIIGLISIHFLNMKPTSS